MRRALAFSLLATSLSGLARGPAGADPQIPPGPGIPAVVSGVSLPKATLDFPVLDASGNRIGTTTWRVVRNSGNCCENHLATTASGRIVDFGGTYIHFSDNRGVSWKRVQPREPLVGGEGTVVVAPNGDILGVGWDVYSGDRILTFKYDAKADAWTYMYEVLHTPGYDREWIAMVPKALRKSVDTPYMTIMKGGIGSKDTWFYSFDGLHYLVASNKGVTRVAAEPISRWLPMNAVPAADWIQPIGEASITPLPAGGAIAREADLLDGMLAPGWSIFDRNTLRWVPFRLDDGSQLPPGRLAIDSKGRAHLVDVIGNQVEYRLSSDGGRTWAETVASLPDGHNAEDWDMRVNGALDEAVVGIHAHTASNTDQDVVLRFSTACDAPEHRMTHLVGKGDLNVSSGFGADIRFDFATVSLFADGAVATSMMDSNHRTPSLAIELETELDPGVELPEPGCVQP